MYLAFYKGKGDWTDWIIRKWTKSKYSHVELIIGEPEDGIWYSSSPRSLRVEARHINYHSENWDIVSVSGSEYKVRNFYLKTMGAKYDWMAIFFSVGILKWYSKCLLQNPKKYICSEWCATALGLENACKYTPGSLAKQYGVE